MLSISIHYNRIVNIGLRKALENKLTKDDISFEAQIEICDVVLVTGEAVFADKHVDIGTCHSVNNFRFADSLNFLRFPLVWSHFVLESVGSGLASIWLLDGADY